MAVTYRAAGEWEQSQKMMAGVGKQEPRDALILTNVGLSYQYLRNFDSAIYFHDKAIAVMPNWTASYANKIEALIERDGDTHEANIVLDTALIKTKGRLMKQYRIMFDIYANRLDAALLKTEVADSSDFNCQGDRYLLFAQIYGYMKNLPFSKEYYKKAFDYFKKLLASDQKNVELVSSIGIALAGLNDKMRAIEYGQEAIELTDKDIIYKNLRMKNLALIYVMLGENERSLNLIEELLKNPSDISVKLLLLDPAWKPLWNMEKFKSLTLKYSKNIKAHNIGT